MSYFNKILNGNVPMSVVESITGYQENYRLNNVYSYLQLNESKSPSTSLFPLNQNKLEDSVYGAYVTSSIELDRNKVVTGINSLLNIALTNAFTRNKYNLLKFAQMSTPDIQLLDTIFNIFFMDFANSVNEIINLLKIDNKKKEIILNIIHLTGLTNKSKVENDNVEKQLALNFELHNQFKIIRTLNIVELLKNKIFQSNKNKCDESSTFKCIFDDNFINNLAKEVTGVLEDILGTMMDSSKHDKICDFYAFSVELASTLVKIVDNKITEHFGGVNIGNTTTNSSDTARSTFSDLQKDIDQSKVIKGMASLLSKSITEASSKNSGDLLRAIAASNSLSIGSVKGTSFTLSNMNQSSTIDTAVKSSFVQNISNKISNDLSNSFKAQIESAANQTSKSNTTKNSDSSDGTNVSAVVGAVASAASDILAVNIGNTSRNNTSASDSAALKDKYSLNASFKVEKDESIGNEIANKLSSDNLAKCAADSKAANSINLNSIDVTGPIVIDKIVQTNVVKDVMDCVFNQTVINEIATKLVTSYDNLITSMITSIDDKVDVETKKKISGDIYAAGVAGKQVLEGVGTAAQGVGAGVSDAAKGVGTGLADAARGIGEGIGDIFTGFSMPLIVAGGILLLLIIGFVIYKTMSSSKSSNGNSGDAGGDAGGDTGGDAGGDADGDGGDTK